MRFLFLYSRKISEFPQKIVGNYSVKDFNGAAAEDIKEYC